MSQMAQQRDIHSVSINDDGNLFVACMDNGIRVYNMEPLVGKLFIDSTLVGSVSICKLLHRTNLIALVGGGSRPKFADNTVLIWDDDKKRFVLEFTFPNPVLSLKTRRDRLFVVERHRIHCFTFPNSPTKLFSIDTRDNPLGICEVTPLTSATELQLLAYPGHRLGTVQLLNLTMTHAHKFTNHHHQHNHVAHSPQANYYQTNSNNSSNNGQNDEKCASSSISPSSINAHTSDIASIALNRTGTLLATASRKGTLIRVFRTIEPDHHHQTATTTGAMMLNNNNAAMVTNSAILSPVQICEFRRGLDQAMVYGIVFSPDSEYLLVSSDKGTVHIFAIKEQRFNRRSKLSVPLVQSANASLAKFTLAAECACVCSFGLDGRSVYAVCVDGTFHKYNFKNDGSCQRESFDNFMNIPEERSDSSAQFVVQHNSSNTSTNTNTNTNIQQQHNAENGIDNGANTADYPDTIIDHLDCSNSKTKDIDDDDDQVTSDHDHDDHDDDDEDNCQPKLII